MDWVSLALSIGDKLLDHIPNYEQRKKARYKKIMTIYRAEIAKPFDKRIDDVIANCRDELKDILKEMI